MVMIALAATLASANSIRGRTPRIPVAILVNPLTPVNDLKLTELRNIMLGNRQYWPNNQPIVLLVRAPVAPARTIVLHVIFQMSEAEFRQYWIAKIFRDETATGPKIVYSSTMTAELVMAIPGSIGFLEADKVPPGPKVLTIDGKRPGEKGYPLE